MTKYFRQLGASLLLPLGSGAKRYGGLTRSVRPVGVCLSASCPRLKVGAFVPGVSSPPNGLLLHLTHTRFCLFFRRGLLPGRGSNPAHFCTAYPRPETAAPVIAKSGPRGRSANCGPLFANEAALCFSMLSSCRVLARPLMTSFRTSLLPPLCGALFAGSLPTSFRRLIQNLSKPRGAPSTGLPFDGAPSPNTGSRAARGHLTTANPLATRRSRRPRLCGH